MFLGALVGLLFYLRVIQYPTFVIGGAIAKALGISKVESMYGSTVIFLGQSEAPLMISPYLRTLRTPAMFTVMTSGFAAAGFANFASIAIQIGTIASLQPDRRAQVARLGMLALLAGSMAYLANAAIAGVVAGV